MSAQSSTKKDDEEGYKALRPGMIQTSHAEIKPTVSTEEKLDEAAAIGDADDEADDDEEDSPDASANSRIN